MANANLDVALDAIIGQYMRTKITKYGPWILIAASAIVSGLLVWKATKKER